MTDRLDAQEFIAGYLAEADEYLAVANARLLELEQSVKRGEPNPRAVRDLFRALHTIKGLSAMVGVEPVVDIAHEMEAYLRAADKAGGFSTGHAVEVLLQGTRAIETRVRAIAHGRPAEKPHVVLVDALASLHGELGETPGGRPRAELALPPELAGRLTASEREQLLQGVAKGRRAVRAEFVPSTARAEGGITITSVRRQVEELAEIVKVLPVAGPATAETAGLRFILFVLTDADDAQLAAAAHAAPGSVVEVAASVPAPSAASEPLEEPPEDDSARSYVRVEVSRLDDAMERLSALVVSRFRLARAVAAAGQKGADVRELTAILGDVGRALRDLRGSIMKARMVPVSEVVERIPLLVRTLARTVGKSIRVDLRAGRAELDKAVADRIFPALVHLVRNAVDHAIESPAERRAAGKPEEGLLTIECVPRSDSELQVSISDDGRGVDAAAVAASAGVPLPESSADLLELLCRPGLTTAAQATQVSGRGMGMDIVRRIAEVQLGGTLSLRTEPGRGSTFTVTLPLTLTIVDAFSFQCGAQAFVVPVSMVEEIVEVDEEAIRPSPHPGRAGARGMFARRGEAIPLLPLEALLKAGGDAGAAARKALIVRRAGAPFAFAVDRMIGQQEVVVRPLEDALVRVPGVTGSTDLGDGRPTLVLDLVALAAASIEVRS